MTATTILTAALAALALGCGAADEFEAKRAAILAKPRTMMTDNDGNDFVYYDRDRPITEKDFIDARIRHVAKTRCETMIYCPWSAGFGYFTVPGIGDMYTNSCPYKNTANPIHKFLAIGKDPLQMAIDFCRRENRELFLGIRMNDTHDASAEMLFPPWKKAHPDCLFGTKDKRPPRGSWSAVDFERDEVRSYMKGFMRAFFERYDIDGVEYDFFRHLYLFKSVEWAMDQETSRATGRQLDIMSRFMHDLREIADEVGRKRGRPIVVAIRVPDSFDYCRCLGIDLERWLREKSVDIVIVGGYWQFAPWHETVDRVHALGAKCMVSLDESRIGWTMAWYKQGLLPGRSGLPFYAARIAAARAEGADGVCFFNCQGDSLASFASIDPDATEGISKRYFAVERGTGNYEANYHVYRGARFSKMPDLDPARPHAISYSSVYAFDLTVGDDFGSPVAKERPPKAVAHLLVNKTTRRDFRLRVNDRTLPPGDFRSDNSTNGVYRYAVPVGLLRRGANRFEVEAPYGASGDENFRLVDFLLTVDYPPAAKPGAAPLEKPFEAKAREELSRHLRNTQVKIGGEAAVFHVGDVEFAAKKGILASSLADGEWVVRSFGPHVVLVGGGTHGTLYAVWHFLEDACGAKWFSLAESSLPPSGELSLGPLDMRGRPAFRLRDVSPAVNSAESALLGARHRLTSVRGGQSPMGPELGGGFAYGPPHHCHTFDHYIPASEFLAAHPEWFSYSKRAKRRVGGQGEGQLCLMNAGLRAEMKRRVLAMIRKSRLAASAAGRPPPTVYDVSENDNWNYCECDDCLAATEKWGLSGLLLDFVNEIGAAVKDEFPEVFINTFAYHGTEEPPKGGKTAAENVIVRLCDTKSNQAAAHGEPGNERFLRLVDAWTKTARNVSIWDYAVTFTPEFIGLPFPSEFHYADYIRFARERGVFGFYWQQDRPDLADFWELKYELETKLLENPDLDAAKLMADFLRAYYGAAASDMAAYRRVLDGARRRNGGVVGWFPQLDDFDWIDGSVVAEGQRLFDSAEAKVASDVTLARRVRHARSGLDRLVCLRARRDDVGETAEFCAARRRIRASLPDWMRLHPNVTEKAVSAILEGTFGAPLPERFAGRRVSDYPGLFFTCTDEPPRTIYFMSEPRRAWRCALRFGETPLVALKDAAGRAKFSASLAASGEGADSDGFSWRRLGQASLEAGDVLDLRPDGRLRLLFARRPHLAGRTWTFWAETKTDEDYFWISRIVLCEE